MYCICIIVHYCFYLLSIVTVILHLVVTVAIVALIGCQAFYF